MEDGRFVVEHWQHVGRGKAANGKTPHFFLIEVRGPRGVWPVRAVIIPPNWNQTDACVTAEEQLDLELQDHGLVEVECAVDEGVPGEHTMRLSVGDQHVGDFPFSPGG